MPSFVDEEGVHVDSVSNGDKNTSVDASEYFWKCMNRNKTLEQGRNTKRTNAVPCHTT